MVQLVTFDGGMIVTTDYPDIRVQLQAFPYVQHFKTFPKVPGLRTSFSGSVPQTDAEDGRSRTDASGHFVSSKPKNAAFRFKYVFNISASV